VFGKLTFLSGIFRPRDTRQTEAGKASDRRQDARTHEMVDGKGMDAMGRVTDFEADSQKPRP
jgi:hypothetical protein